MANKGFYTIGVDVNSDVVAAINSGMAPVFEPNSQAYIEQSKGRLRATTNHREAVVGSDVSFVILPTPSAKTDGCFTNKYVLDTIEAIGAALRDKDDYHLVAIVSTVMPGATGGPIKTTLERSSSRRVGDTVGLCSIPDSLGWQRHSRHAAARCHSDRRIGSARGGHAAIIAPAGQRSPGAAHDLHQRERCKIAINTYPTTKISYANMLAALCDHLPGADADEVLEGVGSDTRVVPNTLREPPAMAAPASRATIRRSPPWGAGSA